MKNTCIMAIAFAAVSVGMNAGMTLLPDEWADGVTRQLNVATMIFDRFETGHAARSPAFPPLAFTKNLADPDRFIMTEATSWDPLAMALTGIGLMAMIAHRRRILWS